MKVASLRSYLIVEWFKWFTFQLPWK